MLKLGSFLSRRKFVLGGAIGMMGTFLVGKSSPAYASGGGAVRPASAWSEFTRSYLLSVCGQFATDALSQRKYTIRESSSYFVIGYTYTVAVSVSLIPLNSNSTYIIVMASSSNLVVAQTEHNAIRKVIESVVCIDSCV